jgi:hypothetical protein
MGRGGQRPGAGRRTKLSFEQRLDVWNLYRKYHADEVRKRQHAEVNAKYYGTDHQEQQDVLKNVAAVDRKHVTDLAEEYADGINDHIEKFEDKEYIVDAATDLINIRKATSERQRRFRAIRPYKINVKLCENVAIEFNKSNDTRITAVYVRRIMDDRDGHFDELVTDERDREWIKNRFAELLEFMPVADRSNPDRIKNIHEIIAEEAPEAIDRHLKVSVVRRLLSN